MDPPPEKDCVKESETVPQVTENTGKKKKKKKKKKNSASAEKLDHAVSSEAGSSSYSDLTQENVASKSSSSDNGSKDNLEKKPAISAPLSEEAPLGEGEDGSREKSQASCSDAYDKAQIDDTSSVCENTPKKKKKKKKKKTNKGTSEEKQEEVSESHAVKFKDPDNCEANREESLEQVDAVDVLPSGKLHPASGGTVAVQEETSQSTTDHESTTKMMKNKTKKGAVNDKEGLESGDLKDPEGHEIKTKRVDIVGKVGDDALHTVPSVEKSSSSSPVSSRKKKKNKKAASGFLLSEVSLSEPQNDSDKERNDNGATAEISEKQQVTTRATEDSDLKQFTEERSLLQIEPKERNNLSKVLTITCGLAMDTLRKLFMTIHPTWSNKPDDAKNMDKGEMHLQKHELARFNIGNINKWDVSLITTVLLYSNKCAKEMKKMGFEDAVRTIKEHKNQMISHISSERMTDDEFNLAWETISNSLKTIGADTREIEQVFTDDTLEIGKFYRDMLLKELANNNVVLRDINTRMENMGEAVAESVVSRLSCQNNPTCENQPRVQDLQDGPQFDEWLRFRENVQHFNYNENNYVLITDIMSPEELNQFSVLRSVPWKIVLDFDPSSEEKGMYHDFVTKEGTNSLIDMITPDEIQHQYASATKLVQHIDPHKTQWLFVRGREKDNSASDGTQTVKSWKASSVKHISGFLRCCSDPDKLDKHKPLICVILPFLKETLPFLEVTLERLAEHFEFNEFCLYMVGMKHGVIPPDLQKQYDIHLTDLSPDLLCLGLKGLLEVCPGQEYRMPTCQANLPAYLTHRQYLYLQEYMDVLYDGCEDLPNSEESEEKLNRIINEHRESFLSGNWISFVSLYDNHDARREVGDEVRNHIQRLLDKVPTNQSSIVEIHHLPGTGGSTIARRVLWDLHKFYPCAIAKLDDCNYDSHDDIHFINSLAERISEMHDICQMNPLVLLDGRHSSIETLSSKLVRVLNSKGQRAVLLSCLHRSAKPTANTWKNSTLDVNRRFFVQVKLEDSVTDLNQFKEKYKDYIHDFQKTEKSSPSRVFHFPLLAMLKGLKGFNAKLEGIVHESFDEMEGVQKEIASVVAFIQHYAAQGTPASLIYKAFKKNVCRSDTGRGISYKEMTQLITEHLLNLMIPVQPTRCPRGSTSSTIYEIYTFQHPLIADMVLKRYFTTQKCNILKLTQGFLEFPIFKDDQFFFLVNDLFIRNRSSSRKTRNSILFEEMKSMDSQEAGRLFCELAKKTGNAIVYGHAARFYINKDPPNFQDARSLMAEAFKCKNAQSKILRYINDMKGGILHSELKFMVENDEIESISQLERLAGEALKSFKNARTWPPTFPSPLTGEVKVWIACIDWITKNECNGDTDKAFGHINATAPPFFHTCIGDSFHLLDVVENIIEKDLNLPEPEETRKLVNSLRLSLLSNFNKGKKIGSREKDPGLIRRSEALCSKEKFPKCSEIELKRLQVHYILSNVGQIETMKKEDRIDMEIIDFLLNLLEVLVLVDKQGATRYMACHLIKVSLYITGPKQYPLDRGLQVAGIWMQQSIYNPIPHFYEMMIFFLKILDGNSLEYRDSYNKALQKCREMSQNHCRRYVSTHFLNKTGEGMNRLMTKSNLTREPEYYQNIDEFWTNHCRKKLLECSGRIRIRSKSGKRKQVYIELLQGNIELYVGKNAEIGKAERDYDPGTLVYFVVSFSLEGPVANGITFKPTSSQTV